MRGFALSITNFIHIVGQDLPIACHPTFVPSKAIRSQVDVSVCALSHIVYEPSAPIVEIHVLQWPGHLRQIAWQSASKHGLTCFRLKYHLQQCGLGPILLNWAVPMTTCKECSMMLLEIETSRLDGQRNAFRAYAK